jgi:hypothetical protein
MGHRRAEAAGAALTRERVFELVLGALIGSGAAAGPAPEPIE